MTGATTGISASQTDIAIIGMAAHLPGAQTVSDYWHNLRAGIESIRQLSPETLLANGESPARLRARNYVPAAVELDGFADFDAEFFGFSPKEAAIMDPQHRQFLETAWEALEDAAHPPEYFPGAIGVFAGCGMGSYFYFNLCSNADLVDKTGMFLLRHTGNDKDFLSTRVSHVFDLKGPSLNIQTACSTSLVAVHVAAQSLLNGECDMALAGGVTIELPQGRGYLYQEGEILSPDGHCHAFDHRAQGTIFGSGAGCVVLRRLSDAIADGDHIWAVIKGTAVNNDGAAKAGYLAPSVDGQARAIAEAQAIAGVSAETVAYIECHGTGTYLGDPIEVAALTQAFRETTDKVDFARIGSVKTNIGHLDTAAGVASLIKASLALHHKEIPPSLGYEAPNPAIDFETSPFRVNDRLSPFPALGAPRRAGVNSLGVGGTNAHAVLEEAPPRPASEEADFPFLPLVLSARSTKALDQAAAQLARHLRAHPDLSLADLAYTLKDGRRAFEKRRVLVASSVQEAATLLETPDRHRVFTQTHLGEAPEVVFMFPGGGAQYAGMARDLWETEPVFRDWMEQGLAHLQPKLDFDLQALWLPEAGQEAQADERLKRPSVQLPLIMMVEYALAQLWISWGVRPTALIGHSMGENTAACLAGVLSFTQCIDLVHLRGRLFDTVPTGGMLSVPMAEEDLRRELGDNLDMASVNAPGLCVVSGPQAELDALQARLAARDIEAQRIPIDIAAHSRLLEPILKAFGDHLRGLRLSPPQLPIISNRTGEVLSAADATDPDYWVRHLRGTVQFAKGLHGLMQQPNRIYLEVGPGKALSSLAQANGVPSNQVLSSLRHPEQKIEDDVYFLTLFARLWALGLPLDWAPIWGEAPRLRLSLPTYPFQRSRYFIEPAAAQTAPLAAPWPERLDDIADWGWQPHWRPRAAEPEVEPEDLAGLPPKTWLIFTDAHGVAAPVVTALRAAGQRVITVSAGDLFTRRGEDGYLLAPELGRAGYDALLQDLGARDLAPDQIAHFWLVTQGESFRPGSSFLHRNMEQGFWSLLHLGQALAETGRALHINVATTGAAALKGEALAHPEKATLLGPLGVLPREVPGLTVAHLDLSLSQSGAGLTERLLEELLSPPANLQAALRGERRYEKTYRAAPLPAVTSPELIPKGAAVLITGGFGGIGLALAARLIQEHGARVALLSRQALPPAQDWDATLARDPASPLARRIAALRQLQALGGEVLPIAADICNLEEMRAARRQVETAFGPLHAVIHAAGHIDDAPMLAKSDAAIEAVLAPKMQGTLVLDQVFPDGSLPLLVLFASTSTATTPAGQVDYVAANAFLNAFAESARGGKRRVVALNWGIWADAGMAAEAVHGTPPASQPLSLPMLEEMTTDAAGNRLYSAVWDLSKWWLNGHRTAAGDALIPGTGYLEMIAEALRAIGETGPFTVEDLYFLRPLAVTDAAPRRVELSLSPRDDGFAVEIRSEVSHAGRKGQELNAQASVRLAATPAPARIDPAAIAARLGPAEDGQGLPTPQEAHLRFGPEWRVLNRRALGQGEGLARLALPVALQGSLAAHPLHPALLDIATGWAMGLIAGYRPDHLWVPVGYRRMQVHAPLSAEILSHVRNAGDNRADAPFATFDITLAAPDGRVLAEIEGFQIRRLEGGLTLPPPDPREIRFAQSEDRPLSPAEERLHHNLAQGIPAALGPEAFLRALSAGQSPIYVSSMALPALIAQNAQMQATSTAATGQSFARPDLDSAYVEPRSEVERQLVAFWQDLLGVGQVGVEDSFFDLGGHSLIAVRLFAMIRKTWGVDFPISVLFEAPTIAACAALIEAETGPIASEQTESRDTAPAPRPRTTHLVPMHGGKAGPGRPFFVVAGMFGNVLNLRHMAQQIAPDRPFYGLQARGLFGDQAPHSDFTEAARDYLAEMRQIQPEGPYLLGGFSGGGLIAWEIARQLEAAGEEAAQVVLLDTPLPMRPELTSLDKALIKLQEFRRKGPRYALDWWHARKEWQAQQAVPKSPESADQLNNAAVEAAFRTALPQYHLTARKGPVVLFRPVLDQHWQVSSGNWVSAAKEYVYHDNQWAPYAPALQVIEVPGDHDSMVLDPNVRVMVRHLRRLLAEADAPRFSEAAE